MSQPSKIGRNAPCPCGSGKKYKKCCLAKDQVRAVRQPVRVPVQGRAEPAPRSTKLQSLTPPAKKRWKAFLRADYKARIILFVNCLKDGHLDEETAYGMLRLLYEQTAAQGEQERFEQMVRKLARGYPRIYAKRQASYLGWRVENAIAEDRREDLLVLVKEISVAKSLSVLNHVLAALAYHGQTALLPRICRKFWPDIRKAKRLSPVVVDEFEGQMMDWIIFDYVERHPEMTGPTPQLLRRLEGFATRFSREDLDQYISYLQRQRQDPRKPEDFGPPTTDRAARQHLFELFMEMLGYFRHEADIPFTRAQLAQSTFYPYIRERQLKKVLPKNGELFCPQPESWLRYLNGLNSVYARKAATELLPCWFDYLRSKALIAPETAKACLAAIAEPEKEDLQDPGSRPPSG